MARKLMNWAGPKHPNNPNRGAGENSDGFIEVDSLIEVPSVKKEEASAGAAATTSNYVEKYIKKQVKLAEQREKEKALDKSDSSWHAVSVSPGMSHNYSATAILYPHESWSTWRFKAKQLAKDYLADKVMGSEIKVRPLHGGSYNRVVNVLVDGKPRYILRTPREPKNSDVEAEVAPLLFLQRHTKIQAPRVIVYDKRPYNAIEAPFMIQERLEGMCLYPAYFYKDTISTSRRLCIAYDLGRAFRQLLETRSGVPGRIVFPAGQAGLSGEVGLISITPFYNPPWHVHDTRGARAWHYAPKPARSVVDWMKFLIQTRLDNAKKCWPRQYKTHEKLVKLIKIVDEMDKRSKFKGVAYSLYHWDIAARNIIYNPDAKQDEPCIAVIDWDDCIFAPSFMLCEPPRWIWKLKYFQISTISRQGDPAQGIPPLDAARYADKLKSVFEDAAGPEYIKYTQDPVYAIAREIVEYGIKGTKYKTDERGEEAAYLLQRWQDYLDLVPLINLKI